jgi:hypothetical protein
MRYPAFRILSKVRAFVKQRLFVKMWFAPVWIMLGMSYLLIMTLSFRRIAPCLGHVALPPLEAPSLDENEIQRARLIGQVIRIASHNTPWNSNCFPQAITARILLGIYGLPYAVYFGLARAGDKSSQLKAHAWVTAGQVIVTGGRSFGRFTVVGCFTSRQ